MQVCSFDVPARLLELSLGIEARREDSDASGVIRDNAFRSFFLTLTRSRTEVTEAGGSYRGWRNDDTYAHDVVAPGPRPSRWIF